MILRAIFNDIFLIKQHIHTASFITYSKAIYFASIVDVDIVCYFLLFHETIAPFKKKQYPISNLQFLGLSTKLLSIYLASPYSRSNMGDILSNFFLYIKPNCIIFFKYWITVFTACKCFFWIYVVSIKKSNNKCNVWSYSMC